MEKIKVLRIINRFNLGGPTYNATFLTAYLGDDFETKLIGGKHGEDEGDSTFITDKYQVEYLIVDELQREISLIRDFKAYRKIKQIIQEYQPDVVHTHASKSGFIGRLAAHKLKVPVIVHTFHGHVFHSYFGKLKTLFYKSIEKYLAKRSHAIIAISQAQKKELVELHRIANDNKFKVIPLGFDLERFKDCKSKHHDDFRKKYSLNSNEIVVSIIGRLVPVKNHKWIFDRVVEVERNTTSAFKVLIIGDGELMDDLQTYARSLEKELGKQLFIFTSWIKNVEFALGGSDVVVLGSLNEGTPVSLIEAQASGTPVLTTNVGGVRDVVEDGDTGIIVDDFNTEEFEIGLKELIEDQEKRRKMSQNGWSFVENKFGYQRLCQETGDLYKELLKKSK